MFEVSVKISNEDKKLVKQHTCYEEDVKISREDKTLLSFVDEGKKEFLGEPDTILVTIKIVW